MSGDVAMPAFPLSISGLIKVIQQCIYANKVPLNLNGLILI